MLYIFEGVFEVVAESEEEARHKVIQDCEFMMGRSIIKRSANLLTAPFFRDLQEVKEST